MCKSWPRKFTNISYLTEQNKNKINNNQKSISLIRICLNKVTQEVTVIVFFVLGGINRQIKIDKFETEFKVLQKLV